jgi:hypothetical protein
VPSLTRIETAPSTCQSSPWWLYVHKYAFLMLITSRSPRPRL